MAETSLNAVRPTESVDGDYKPPVQALENNSQQDSGDKEKHDVVSKDRDEEIDQSEHENHFMGPVGPWASGRISWNPVRKFTGIRPVVDRYSVTRYSEDEWKSHNAAIIKRANDRHQEATMIEYNSRVCMDDTAYCTDLDQQNNTKRLEQRAHDIYYWKGEVESATSLMAEELRLLETEKQRVRKALCVLKIPELISGECLDRRAARLEPDLVRDTPEEELIKEVALINEVNELLSHTLKQIEEQLRVNESIKRRLEMDWSDKKDAYDIETTVIGLKNMSPAITFKPGSACIKDAQSSPDIWEPFSLNNIKLLENEREKSKELRRYVDAVLTDASRDLRVQSDRVDAAFSHRIAETHEARQKLENDLQMTVHRIAETEKTIANLKEAIRAKDAPIKVVQTRLDHRLMRPGIENCRDIPQYGLLDEVKKISDSVAALRANLKQNEEALAALLDTKSELECAIMIKRKTISIDQMRCQEIRTYYPSTVSLTGY